MRLALLIMSLLITTQPTRYESRHDPWTYISEWDTGYCADHSRGYGWNGRLDWPTDYREIEYDRGFSEVHQGIDILAEMGSPITAAAAGRVIWAGNITTGGGNSIILDHGGWRTIYAHLDSVSVRCGQMVKRGAVIGVAGMTGAASFPHLHFELRRGAYNYDPGNFWRGER